MYELDCRWNFRPLVCARGMNKCKASNEKGVYLIHGNSYIFYTEGSHFQVSCTKFKYSRGLYSLC